MKNFKKVLSLALALLMVVGCMVVVAPTEAKAATYTRLTNVSELTEGTKFVIVASLNGNYYVPGVKETKGFTPAVVSLDDLSSATVFEITSVSDGKYVINSPEGYLATAKNAFSFKASAPSANWEISNDADGMFQFRDSISTAGTSDANTYYIALNGGNYLRCYVDKSGNTSYAQNWMVYKVSGDSTGGGSNTPTPEPTPTVGTIAEALAGATNSLWTVKGVVTLIDGSNVYIQDTTGGIDAYLASEPTGIALGDTIEVTGKRAEFRGLPELANATYTKSTGLTLTSKTTTIGELTAADVATYVKIVGLEVTEVYDNNGSFSSPNITVTDGTNTIQIYKAVVDKNDDAWAIKVGDKIDVVASVGIYNETLQLRNTLASEITVVPHQWVQDSENGYTIRFDMNFADFKELKINGTVVDPKNYTAVEGSVIVTLKADYLNTLEAGSYTVSAVANDDTTVDANLTVAASNIDNAGDNFLPMFLIIAAGCAIVAVGVIGKKKFA